MTSFLLLILVVSCGASILPPQCVQEQRTHLNFEKGNNGGDDISCPDHPSFYVTASELFSNGNLLPLVQTFYEDISPNSRFWVNDDFMFPGVVQLNITLRNTLDIESKNDVRFTPHQTKEVRGKQLPASKDSFVQWCREPYDYSGTRIQIVIDSLKSAWSRTVTNGDRSNGVLENYQINTSETHPLNTTEEFALLVTAGYVVSDIVMSSTSSFNITRVNDTTIIISLTKFGILFIGAKSGDVVNITTGVSHDTVFIVIGDKRHVTLTIKYHAINKGTVKPMAVYDTRGHFYWQKGQQSKKKKDIFIAVVIKSRYYGTIEWAINSTYEVYDFIMGHPATTYIKESKVLKEDSYFIVFFSNVFNFLFWVVMVTIALLLDLIEIILLTLHFLIIRHAVPWILSWFGEPNDVFKELKVDIREILLTIARTIFDFANNI